MSFASTPLRRFCCRLTLALGALLACSLSSAQTYPAKPVTVVVPYALGGGGDLIARAIQEPMQKSLGQPVIVESRVGASGLVGTRYVARAAADGYTLLLQTNGMLITPHINKAAGYDPLKDFEPVATLGVQTMLLIAHASLPANNVAELIAYAKAHPNKVNFGTSGIASNSRLAMESLMERSGISMTHVPYKGGGEITQALMTGEIQLMLSGTTPPLNQLMDAGKLKLLGAASLKPFALTPQAPTIAQTVPGFEADAKMILFAPSGTPAQAMAKLRQAVQTALADPDVRRRIEAAGAVPGGLAVDALKLQMAQEFKATGELVKRLQIANE